MTDKTAAYPIATSTVLYNPTQADEYFGMLFRNVDWQPGQVISVLGIGEKGTPQEGVFRERQIVPPGFMALAHKHLKRWAGHEVAGFIVPAVLHAAAQDKGDVTLDKVAALTAIVLDIDSGDVTAKAKFVTERLGKPSMIVASGGLTDEGKHKAHLYWLFNEPCEDVERVAALRKALAAKAGGDQSFGRATQVVRVPGSVHAKHGKATVCRILDRSDAEYSFEDLVDIIENMQPMQGLPVLTVTPLPGLGGMMDFAPRQDTALVAMHRDINEGGEDLTRWGEFSKVAGFNISEARAGRLTPEAAYDATSGWVLSHMVPPWPQARIDQEFKGLLVKDITGHGPFSAAIAMLPKEAPRPLYRELAPPTAFPLDALGPVLSKAAEAIAAMIDCPLECAANSVLAVASLAAQGRADVILPVGSGKPAPLSLFLMTVLESGERKSSADSMALKPVRDFEHELAQDEAILRQAYKLQSDAFETNAKHLNSKHKADRTSLVSFLEAMGPPPQPPLLSVLAPSSDQTIEGLFRVYQYGRPSLAMLCDDAASFLGGHSMKAEQKQTTTASLCRAWDGAKLERIRGGDGVIILYDRRLACHMMVQPGVAASFLSDNQFADQGLLARFLISAPVGRAGTRVRDDIAYQAKVRDVAGQMGDYNIAVDRLLRQPIRWNDDSDRTLGVQMDQLHLTSEARALYVAFCNAIEKELAPKASLTPVKAFASKLPDNAARIAGILALVEDPNASGIEVETLSKAIELARYYLHEALRLVAAGAIDPDLRQAEVVRKWLQDQPRDEISLRQVYQQGPNSIRQASKARSAMQVLAAHGWVIKLPHGATIDGNICHEVWEIVRC